MLLAPMVMVDYALARRSGALAVDPTAMSIRTRPYVKANAAEAVLGASTRPHAPTTCRPGEQDRSMAVGNVVTDAGRSQMVVTDLGGGSTVPGDPLEVRPHRKDGGA